MKWFSGCRLSAGGEYVNMILSGALPKNGERLNTDAKILLKMFLPAGARSDGFDLVKIVRTLCLAFKGMDAEEVYNILAGCLIRALNQYDPYYTTRVKEVIVAVDRAFDGPPPPASVTFHQVSESSGI